MSICVILRATGLGGHRTHTTANSQIAHLVADADIESVKVSSGRGFVIGQIRTANSDPTNTKLGVTLQNFAVFATGVRTNALETGAQLNRNAVHAGFVPNTDRHTVAIARIFNV